MSEFDSLLLYIFVYGISTILFSLHRHKNIVIAKIGIALSIMIPTLLAGLRFEVGTDYSVYYYIFDNIRKCSYQWILTDSWHFNEERGFLVVSKFVSDILGPRNVFGFYGLLILLIFVYTLIKQYRNYNLSIFYFLFLLGQYTASLNTLRQSLALVMLFWGFQYVFEGKIVKYGTTILFAAMFHTTAVVAIPIYFLWNHKRKEDLKLWKKTAIYFLAIILVALWNPLLTLLNTNLSGFYILKYTTYLVGNETNNRSFYLKLLLGIIFIIIEKYLKSKDIRLSLFVNIYLVGVIFEFTGFYSTFVKRISEYYCGYAGIILLGSLPLAFRGYTSKMAVKVLVCSYELLLFIVVSYLMGQGGYFPYKV